MRTNDLNCFGEFFFFDFLYARQLAVLSFTKYISLLIPYFHLRNQYSFVIISLHRGNFRCNCGIVSQLHLAVECQQTPPIQLHPTTKYNYNTILQLHYNLILLHILDILNIFYNFFLHMLKSAYNFNLLSITFPLLSIIEMWHFLISVLFLSQTRFTFMAKINDMWPYLTVLH